MGGRFYYFRRGDTKGELRSDTGKRAQFFDQPVDGDIIGMLVDVESGGVAFALNGKYQGSCTVKRPGEPLYFFTTVDRPNDHMELRKSPLCEAPVEVTEALQALIVSKASFPL